MAVTQADIARLTEVCLRAGADIVQAAVAAGLDPVVVIARETDGGLAAGLCAASGDTLISTLKFVLGEDLLDFAMRNKPAYLPGWASVLVVHFDASCSPLGCSWDQVPRLPPGPAS